MVSPQKPRLLWLLKAWITALRLQSRRELKESLASALEVLPTIKLEGSLGLGESNLSARSNLSLFTSLR